MTLAEVVARYRAHNSQQAARVASIQAPVRQPARDELRAATAALKTWRMQNERRWLR